MPPKKKSNENESTEEDIRDMLKNIEKKINESEASLKCFVDGKLTNLANRISELESIVFSSKSLVETLNSKTNNLEESVKFLDNRVENIHTSVKSFETKLQDVTETNSILTKKIKVLEARLEDQINRSCRKTLIVKNVPEEVNETWEKTKKLVANILNKVCKTNIKPEENIERAHRGKKNPILKKPRDIHISLFDWNDADDIISGFKKYGLSNPQRIFVEQRYGPDTTWRRNQAMILRKQLKEERKISSGYVAYPAKLLVKKFGDDKYSLHKDFSNTEVSNT